MARRRPLEVQRLIRLSRYFSAKIAASIMQICPLFSTANNLANELHRDFPFNPPPPPVG